MVRKRVRITKRPIVVVITDSWILLIEPTKSGFLEYTAYRSKISDCNLRSCHVYQNEYIPIHHLKLQHGFPFLSAETHDKLEQGGDRQQVHQEIDSDGHSS